MVLIIEFIGVEVKFISSEFIVHSFEFSTAYCLLPTAYCLLPTAYCLLKKARGGVVFSDSGSLDTLVPALCLIPPCLTIFIADFVADFKTSFGPPVEIGMEEK